MGDPGKFLIPCDFPEKAECLALADLDKSINLIPFFVWNKLSLPDFSHTCMTLELADLLISHSVGVAEDVYVKVGTFHFQVDFVVVDFDADPRVPLILGRSFLKTERALIDVDFLLEEVDAFLALEDDPTLPEVDQSYVNSEGDILLLEAFLNDDPSLPLPNQGNYQPEVRKELRICEAKSDKSSIDESPEVELKDLPPHLEYAFSEDDDKLPVIIEKSLSVEEKTTLIMGIKPEFYTHKILMEEDYKPAVQHQRQVNPKIHDVIKKEVEKLLDAGLIYPISDSSWVSPVHCVPKKGKDNVHLPYGTFAYRRMPFSLYNVPGTFQRCMLAIFHNMVEKTMEIFMDDFSVFGNSFENCLSRLDKMLQRCEDTNLSLNWEKSHFMVKEGIVLGHKISKNGIEVDRAKVDVIAKLPHPTTVKGDWSFLGHAGFYRRFIHDFFQNFPTDDSSSREEHPFIFSKDCIKDFQTLKKKLTEAPILIAPN
nr:hypothetical protein [Tanacetum cinerariifolium]